MSHVAVGLESLPVPDRLGELTKTLIEGLYEILPNKNGQLPASALYDPVHMVNSHQQTRIDSLEDQVDSLKKIAGQQKGKNEGIAAAKGMGAGLDLQNLKKSLLGAIPGINPKKDENSDNADQPQKDKSPLNNLAGLKSLLG